MLALLLAGLAARDRVARAATLTVTSAADSGAGSLRAEIAAAAAGATIVFAAALQGNTITLTTGTLTIGKNLTIDGTGRAITVDGNKQYTVLRVSSGVSLMVKGLTMTLAGQPVTPGAATRGPMFPALPLVPR